MNEFEAFSAFPGGLVDLETGEKKELDLSGIIDEVKTRVRKYIKPKYKQEIIDQAREVTSPIGETILCRLLSGKTVEKRNHKGHDLILPGGEIMEAKIGRIGNSAVIKKDQLDFMDTDGFYGIVYYRTTKNLAPSHFIAQDTKLDPKTYLRRNITIESVFIFPRSYMVYYYNTSDVKEGKISTTGVCHKPFAHSRAKTLFLENKGNMETYTDTKVFGRHEINVFSVGYEV